MGDEIKTCPSCDGAGEKYGLTCGTCLGAGTVRR
jgi:DnaJ-class molecular chaperone